mgnify:CR=1 FL=1
MRRLILDYYRRWRLPITACIIAEIWLGVTIQGNPNVSLEFFGFIIALWAGATLYIFDTSRGIRLGLVILPITERQISMAWLLQTLVIPFFAMAFCLTLGAIISYVITPYNGFHISHLLKYAILNLTWLGTAILPSLLQVVYSNPPSFLLTTHPQNKNFLSLCRIGYGLFGILGQIPMFATMLLCQNTVTNPIKFTIFVALGIVYAGIAWYVLIPNKMSRMSIADVPQIKPATFHQHVKTSAVFNIKGRGGIPYLIKSALLQELWIILITLGSIFIGIIYFHFAKTTPIEIFSWATSSSYLISLVFLIGSFSAISFIISQLRFLRSLPILPIQLVTLIYSLLLLPNLILTILLFLFLNPGLPFILTCAFGYGGISLLISLVFASQTKSNHAILSVFIAIGVSIVVIAPQLLNMLQWNRAHSAIIIVSALAIPIGFLITYKSLKTSSKAYRM